MGIKSYLSHNQKEDLLNYLAATGENYDKYLEYCEQYKLKPFSQKYLHTWIQRRRPKFQKARRLHQEELKRLSMYDKTKRIEGLENDMNMLNAQLVKDLHNCPKCGEPHSPLSTEVIIKLTEQKRKISEAIAKERNEWLKPEPDAGDEQSPRERLRSALAKVLNEGQEVQSSYAEVVVAED